VANGPVAPSPGPRPLAVKLDRPRDPVTIRFAHPPRSGLLFDLDTGAVLWRRAPERVLPIASLTKMMTALLVVVRKPADARIRITRTALRYQGSGVGLLPRGRRVRVETLLYGLLLPSGNDAARALAEGTAGSLRAFVALMNRQAAYMGLRCTHYSSVDGYLDAGTHSCAVDLAAQARAVLDQPRLARIVGSRSAVKPLPIKGGRVYLYNNNPLLRLRYPGTIGVKTGYTDAAGHCLVAAVERHGRRLGVVLLHSPDTYTQARRLLDRGFRAIR
jgi:D-alanyl-D-alanine carboxypeptidase